MPFFIVWGIFLFAPVFLIRYLFLAKISKRMRRFYAVLILIQIILFLFYGSTSGPATGGDPAGNGLSRGYAALFSFVAQLVMTIVMAIVYAVHFSFLSKAEKHLIAQMRRHQTALSRAAAADRKKKRRRPW